jgi:hypothetical protein
MLETSHIPIVVHRTSSEPASSSGKSIHEWSRLRTTVDTT